jgi:hypothetical protein
VTDFARYELMRTPSISVVGTARSNLISAGPSLSVVEPTLARSSTASSLDQRDGHFAPPRQQVVERRHANQSARGVGVIQQA